MTVTVKQKKSIRAFVSAQLRAETDLSTLTLRILKKRYLAHTSCDSFTSDAKSFMKQVVGEELMKMQDDHENESETKKRKREEGNESDEEMNGTKEEAESVKKKSRRRLSSSDESEEEENRQAESEEEEERVDSGSEDEEQEVKKPEEQTRKPATDREASSDQEVNESAREEGESEDGDEKPPNTAEEDETESRAKSDEEDESDGESEKRSESSDDGEKEEKTSEEKKDEDPDSGSSSPSSGEEDGGGDVEKEKKKKSATPARDADKALSRLKRYIALCGIRRNYKKLLEGCSSARAREAALKKQLEELGVHGQPSIKKCKRARLKRERAQELAELDTNNIIATKGRPTRSAALPRHKQRDSPVRALNSSSDSEQDGGVRRGSRRATDWDNLKGIISDDGDSC